MSRQGIMLITHRERAGRFLEPWRGPGVSQIHPVPEPWASLPGAASVLILQELGQGIQLICPCFLVHFCHGKLSLYYVVEYKPRIKSNFCIFGLPLLFVEGRQQVTLDSHKLSFK